MNLHWCIVVSLLIFFRSLPDDVRVEEHMDVDILVSDYFLAKRILDGDGYYANGIDMVEDGGDKVLNIVTVGM